MGHNNALSAKVNFVISVVFLAAAALLAMTTIINAADMDNPIENVFISNTDIDSLER
jgi:hypothetical protein